MIEDTLNLLACTPLVDLGYSKKPHIGHVGSALSITDILTAFYRSRSGTSDTRPASTGSMLRAEPRRCLPL
jgi:hypothetical protein